MRSRSRKRRTEEGVTVDNRDGGGSEDKIFRNLDISGINVVDKTMNEEEKIKEELISRIKE